MSRRPARFHALWLSTATGQRKKMPYRTANSACLRPGAAGRFLPFCSSHTGRHWLWAAHEDATLALLGLVGCGWQNRPGFRSRTDQLSFPNSIACPEFADQIQPGLSTTPDALAGNAYRSVPFPTAIGWLDIQRTYVLGWPDPNR